MSFTVLKAGLQTTLQGGPFSGQRDFGMPAAGAADCLSLALANFLVGKNFDEIAIEITITDAIFAFNNSCLIGVVGGAQYVRINDEDHPQHQTLKVNAGDTLQIGPSRPGCRTYLSISARIQGDKIFGNQSTYLAAGLGGFRGRQFQAQDEITFSKATPIFDVNRTTPENLRPHYSDDHVLRIIRGPEAGEPAQSLLEDLCTRTYSIGARASRMGMALEGKSLNTSNSANMPSAAVFPGTIQLPPSGQPYLLGPDAQTTGGYLRIAQVIRADRHLIGQLSSGSRIQFVSTTTERATKIYREKLSLLSFWLGQIKLW